MKKKIKKILALTLLFLLPLAGFFAGKHYSDKNQKAKVVFHSVDWQRTDTNFLSKKHDRVGIRPNQIFSYFYLELLNTPTFILPESVKNLSLIWQIKNINVLINDPSGIFLYFSKDKWEDEAFNQSAGNYYDKLLDIFKTNFYQVSANNTSKKINKEGIEISKTAFEHPDHNINCVVEKRVIKNPPGEFGRTQEQYPNITLVCTDKLDENYQIQKPFWDDLSDNFDLINISKIVNNFALVNIGSQDIGPWATKVLYKENDKWTPIIESLQAPPSCEIINQYSVPKEIVNNCY